MISYLKNIYRKFIYTDLRLKLKFLSKKTKINFYPRFFYRKGLRGIWLRIIFYFLHKEHSKKDYLIKKNILFKTNIDITKIKLICVFPRSGGSYFTALLNSYFEIKNNFGDGRGKFLNNYDKQIFNINQSDIYLHLYGLTTAQNNIIQKSNIDYNRYYFSHYPINDIDLLDIKKLKKKVFLIRDPLSVCNSYILHYLNRDKYYNEKLDINNEKKINKYKDTVIKNYKVFFSHIVNEENKIIFKFNEFVNDPEKTIRILFNYYEDKIDEFVLKKILEINTFENYKKASEYFKYSNRISNNEDLNYLKEKLSKEITDKLSQEIELFKEL